MLCLAVMASDALAHSYRWRVLHYSAAACSQRRPLPCIRRAAFHHRVSYRLQRAIAWCESKFDPWVVNRIGASGLMQFKRGTFGGTPYRRRPILRAKWNALAGAWLLAHGGTGPWAASRSCWG